MVIQTEIYKVTSPTVDVGKFTAVTVKVARRTSAHGLESVWMSTAQFERQCNFEQRACEPF